MPDVRRAIANTAAGGEISVLDPGGFGVVTISKAISIVNDQVGEAGILAAGTDGVVINAGPNDAVSLRGLVINGLGTGLNGVKFISGGSLNIQNCVIQQFATGVSFAPSANGAKLLIRDTDIVGNAGGISIKPSAGVLVKASLAGV